MKPKFSDWLNDGMNHGCKYFYCSRCGETAVNKTRPVNKKRVKQTKRLKFDAQGNFTKNQSFAEEFKIRHSKCNKECINCNELFDSVDLYNNHLPRCNLAALIHCSMIPAPLNKPKLRNKEVCKGK